MSGPDVEHAGWAIAGSPLRRRRSAALGAVAAVLLIGGLAAAILGLVRAAAETGPSADEIVASGVVAGLDGPDAEPARFLVPRETSMTVWLRLDGVRDAVREQVVGSVACEAARADGRREAFRGSRQGTSIAVERFATVGVFRASEGTTAVACRQLPFGRRARARRLGSEKAFVVVAGRPAERVGGLLWLIGGVAAALLGIPVGLRWWRGRLEAA